MYIQCHVGYFTDPCSHNLIKRGSSIWLIPIWPKDRMLGKTDFKSLVNNLEKKASHLVRIWIEFVYKAVWIVSTLIFTNIHKLIIIRWL